MLNFEFATEADRREAAVIEKRRALNEERKKRIFGPKAKIYIDYEALDEQIQQKRKREEQERQRDLQYQQQAAQYVEIGKALDEKEREERKRLAQEINNFRLNFQKKEDRREFDLNDPKNYKSYPARLYDDDPRCGPSSIQKFEGEDLYSKERSAIQRDQMKAWLDQQMEEKEAAEKDRIDAENAYKAALMARDHRAIQLETIEKECRQRLDAACRDYNRALADEQAIKRAQRAKQDLQDSLAHKYNVMMSDMMKESLDSQSALGTGRKIAGQFKGMTHEEKTSFINALKSQIDEAHSKKMHDERFKKEWDEYLLSMSKTCLEMEEEQNRQKREISKKIQEENKQLSIEQKNHQAYLKNIVYSNKPTAAFYEQFNKTAR